MMFIFARGFEWQNQCHLAFVTYDGHDEYGSLDYPSRSSWIVPGTIMPKDIEAAYDRFFGL